MERSKVSGIQMQSLHTMTKQGAHSGSTVSAAGQGGAPGTGFPWSCHILAKGGGQAWAQFCQFEK